MGATSTHKGKERASVRRGQGGSQRVRFAKPATPRVSQQEASSQCGGHLAQKDQAQVPDVVAVSVANPLHRGAL